MPDAVAYCSLCREVGAAFRNQHYYLVLNSFSTLHSWTFVISDTGIAVVDMS